MTTDKQNIDTLKKEADVIIKLSAPEQVRNTLTNTKELAFWIAKSKLDAYGYYTCTRNGEKTLFILTD